MGIRIEDRSPIYKLNEDVLRDIFKINSSMYGQTPGSTPRAITATRSSSQVNTHWRNLICSSPELWGNVIDIEMLENNKETNLNLWRDEVFRRAQNAPLHVQGLILLPPWDKDSYDWLSFVKDNWARIWKIQVVIGDIGGPTLRDDDEDSRDALSFLSTSPMLLESYNIVFSSHFTPLRNGHQLFNDNAPKLWLRQIRYLKINELTSKTFASVEVCCQILSEMTQLECLCLEHAIASPNVNIHRKALNLPRLRYIYISEAPRPDEDINLVRLTCWPLLNSIIPQVGCSIEMELKVYDTMTDLDMPTLSRIIKDYFSVHRLPHLHLDCSERYFTLTDLRETYPYATHPYDRTEGGPVIFFRVSDQWTSAEASTRDTVIVRLLESLPLLSFPDVTQLYLGVSVSRKHFDLFTNPRVIELMKSFSAVEELTTTAGTMSLLSRDAIWDSYFTTSGLFRRVRTLLIKRTFIEMNRIPPLPHVLFLFLEFLRTTDAPVSSLRARWSGHEGQIRKDLLDLSANRGLSVAWFMKQITGEFVPCTVMVFGSRYSRSVIAWG